METHKQASEMLGENVSQSNIFGLNVLHVTPVS